MRQQLKNNWPYLSNLAEQKDELGEIAMLVLENNNDIYTQDFIFITAGMKRLPCNRSHYSKTGSSTTFGGCRCGQGAWLAEFWRLALRNTGH